MAYPMVQAMKLGDFIQRCCSEFGCTVVERTPGKPETRHLRRHVEGKGRYFAPLPRGLGDDDRMAHNVMRSMCIQLGIEPQQFGFSAHTDGN